MVDVKRGGGRRSSDRNPLVVLVQSNIYMYAPEGCQHGTHTNGTAYTRGTYSRAHTQTQTNAQRGPTKYGKEGIRKEGIIGHANASTPEYQCLTRARP